jgi:uncharacterized YccA/Bax inhibitor family protein
MRFGSSNPVFKRALDSERSYANYEAATYAGVSRKLLYFVSMVLIGVFLGIYFLKNNAYEVLIPTLFLTSIFSFISIISPAMSKVFGTLYCIGEGMIVGVVSYVVGAEYQGIVFIALLSTIVVLVVVATLFLTNIVKVNDKFMRFLLTFSISVIISVILMFIFGYGRTQSFGIQVMVSAIMVFLATLYLFFDIENIRRVVEGGAPKQMEWYVSFGLVFTLVWLYLEVLRIVAIIMKDR